MTTSLAKMCAITGPTSGIGEATALELARQGFGLLLICRDCAKGDELASRCRQQGANVVTVQQCDLSSLDSVRTAAAQILEDFDHIDVLINNAGLVNKQRSLSVDGHEMMFATNHLGPFLLTNLLLPLLEAAEQGRIVNVASGAHSFVKGINFDDMDFERGFSIFKVYGHSKLCNILFTRSLAERLEGSPVTVNSLHPGAVSTSLGAQNGRYVKLIYTVLGVFFRTPEKGARSSIYLATRPEGGTSNGKYFYDCRAIEPKSWARDDAAAERLWELSAHLTGLDAAG